MLRRRAGSWRGEHKGGDALSNRKLWSCGECFWLCQGGIYFATLWSTVSVACASMPGSILAFRHSSFTSIFLFEHSTSANVVSFTCEPTITPAPPRAVKQMNYLLSLSLQAVKKVEWLPSSIEYHEREEWSSLLFHGAQWKTWKGFTSPWRHSLKQRVRLKRYISPHLQWRLKTCVVLDYMHCKTQDDPTLLLRCLESCLMLEKMYWKTFNEAYTPVAMFGSCLALK